MHGVSSWKTGVIAIAACAGLVGTACGNAGRIRTVQDVPRDVERIVDQVWADLTLELAWAADCMLPVELFLTRSVDDGAARYRAEEQVIDIEIPTSPRRFRESLAHELGHHIDASCSGLEARREAFLDAQGFDPDAAWDRGATWETTPAEHFAEAVVVIVNGERHLHDGVVISSSAIDIVRAPPQ